MKFASWEFKFAQVRLPHLLEWLARQAPQIVCLQEIKLETPNSGGGDPGGGVPLRLVRGKDYNGVAILSRDTLANVGGGNACVSGRAEACRRRNRGEGAHAIRAVCAYVPNGQAVGSENTSTAQWLAAFRRWLEGED